MNDNSGALSFGTAVDTSGFEQGMAVIEEGISTLGTRAEQASMSIQEALTNVPKIDLQVVTNTSNLDTIKLGLEETVRIIELNKEGICQLEEEYQRLSKECGDAFQAGNFDHSVQLAKERDGVEIVINARKKAISEANKYNNKLREMHSKISAEAAVQEKSKAALDQKTKSAQSLRTRMRELTMEAAALRDAAQQEGVEIDKTTGRYREIIEELGRLRDIQGDINTAGNVFANDENQFAGVISGLNGLVGGFTAAQGAIALFGTENEDLQRVMLKVQSLMSITMGLQQVQQALNKDSAFQLVTLNGLKQWWNKLLVIGAGAQATETAATEAGVAAKLSDTAAEGVNATATTAAAAAKELKATATGEAAAAEALDTAATGANAVAAGAGTAANIGLAGAFRMVGAAISSIPVFGWIAAAIGVLIGVISHFIGKANEADEKLKEQQEFIRGSREEYAKASLSIKTYQKRIEDFNGTTEEENQLVAELNQKFGTAMGQHKTLAEWKQTLAEKGEAYCRAIEKEALAQAYLNKYTEAYIHLLEVEDEIKAGKYHHWYNTKLGDDKADDAARAAAQADVDRYQKEYEKAMQEAQSIRQGAGLSLSEVSVSSPKGGAGGGSTPAKFDAKAAAREQRKQYEDYVSQVKGFIRDANVEVTDYAITMHSDGLMQELNVIRKNSNQRIEAWKDTLRDQAELRKQYLHDVYMTTEGATEDIWEASDAGRKSIEEYMKEFLHGADLSKVLSDIDFARTLSESLEENDPAKAWLNKYVAEVELAEYQVAETRQKYFDQWVESYGTVEQKQEVMWRKYTKLLNSIPAEFHDAIYEAWDIEESNLNLDQFKKSLNWEEVFGNLDAVATSSLQRLKTKLQQFIKTQKDLSPEAAKALAEAIEKIDDKLTERNPFDALSTSFSNLKTANRNVRLAQEAYNEALKNGTELEKKNAEATLAAAKNAKQKALAEATKAMQATAGKLNEYIGIANDLMDCLSTFGVELPPELTGFIEGIGGAVDALENIDLTKPTSIIKGAIGVVSGLGKAIGSLFNHDARKEKKIQKMQKQVEALERAYDKLGESIDKAFSTDASNLIKQQNQMLEQQKILIQQQIKEEKSKKHTDNDRIREWEQQIEDINATIAANKEAAIDAIFGSDLKSAIEGFADAYADAWASGEDRAKSAKDYVRSMMKQMVKESIKAAIQASGQMDAIRKKLEQFYSDKILSGWEQDYILNMAEALQKELDQQFGWADSLLGDDATREGTQKGIATASQDSVDENNARLTTIQEHTYNLTQGMEELNSTSNAILDKVAGIEKNTAKSADNLDDVKDSVKKIKNTVDEIQSQGIKLRN